MNKVLNGIDFPLVKLIEIPQIIALADEIWNSNYQEMISQAQIDYMLAQMYHPEKIQEEINQNYAWHFIFYRKNPIGFFCFYPKENKIFLSKIYLKTAFQKKGIAQKVLTFIEEKAKSLGYKAIFLTVNKTNLKAQKSYLTFGFQVISSEVFDIGNGFVMDDFVMEKNS